MLITTHINNFFINNPRLVHGVAITVLQSLLNVDYKIAKAAFVDLVMYDNMKVGSNRPSII